MNGKGGTVAITLAWNVVYEINGIRTKKILTLKGDTYEEALSQQRNALGQLGRLLISEFLGCREEEGTATPESPANKSF
jgi:hypothetical protein